MYVDGEKIGDVINQYQIIETIGEGAFGKVKKCLEKTTNKFFAAKIIKQRMLRKKYRMKGYCLWKEIKKEIALLKKTDHPNIINLKEVIIEEKSDQVFFIMDYLKNGSLQALDDFSQKSIMELKIKMLKILDAVYYLHNCA